MAEVNRTAIEQRAHKIWIARGRRDGHALQDWAQAEVELRAEAARGSKPAATGFGGNLVPAPAPSAVSKWGVTPAAKGGAAPAAKGGAAPAAGSATSAGGVAAPAGSAPTKNGNRPSKNGRGKKK